MTNVSTPRGAGSSVLWTSVTLGGGVRPKVELTQSLQKAVHGVQIALNIADVSAPAAGQQPVRRMAARRTRHHLLLWPASLRWTRR
jgi:hypothetical protein